MACIRKWQIKMTRRHFSMALWALTINAALGNAQPQPRTFFKDRIQLSDADIGKIDQGQVVTKVLESGDKKYGLLVFGAVYINAPVAKFGDAIRDIKSLIQNPVYKAVEEFSLIG